MIIQTSMIFNIPFRDLFILFIFLMFFGSVMYFLIKSLYR